MTAARSLRLAIAALLAAATAALSALSLAALNAGGEVNAGPVPLMRLAAGYSRPAEKLLATPQPPPAAQAQAERLSRLALAQFPYDNSSWLRLAYVDALRHGRLTPDGVALLRRSYELTPIDIYAGTWRIGFVLENSQSVPRDVRLAARSEFEALWRDPRNRQELTQLAAAIQNPAGRLSAALWLRRARDSVAK